MLTELRPLQKQLEAVAVSRPRQGNLWIKCGKDAGEIRMEDLEGRASTRANPYEVSSLNSVAQKNDDELVPSVRLKCPTFVFRSRRVDLPILQVPLRA